MTTTDDHRLYLDDLCKRWRMNADQVVEMAIAGEVELWLSFSQVLVRKESKAGGGSKKKKSPAPQLHEWIEVKPRAEMLAQIQGRCDRMLVAAELSCLDAGNKAVVVSNSVGDEWGETSMLGIKPANLFARLDNVLRFEKINKLTPNIVPLAPPSPAESAEETGLAANREGHPYFAPELQAAAACWNALFSQPSPAATGIKKADILAWLLARHPDLSRAALDRIASVITPANGKRR